MSDSTKLVDFYKYCKTCINKDLNEVCDPCNDCLCVSGREGTEVPIYYEKDPKVKEVINNE